MWPAGGAGQEPWEATAKSSGPHRASATVVPHRETAGIRDLNQAERLLRACDPWRFNRSLDSKWDDVGPPAAPLSEHNQSAGG